MEPRPAIDIRLLGRFAVRRDGEEVPPDAFGRRQARVLLRMLVTRGGGFASKAALADALWGDRLPADPAANLEVLVSRARRALGDPSLIAGGSGGYRLVLDDRCRVDADIFRGLVARGRDALAAGRAADALALFEQSLDVWGGEPLPEDAYEDWAQEYRRALLLDHFEALESGAAAAFAAGRPARAAALARQAVALEPLREGTHLLLARALAASNDRAGALEALHELRTALADELGIDPSSAAAELELYVLRGEPLPAAGWLPPPPVRRAGDRSGRLEHAAPARGNLLLPLVGREEQLAQLVAALGGGSGRRPVLVSGAAGTGKSRLVAEASERSPVPILAARAVAPERDEPWAVLRVLLRDALALDIGAAGAVPDRSVGSLVDVVPELEQLRSAGAGAADAESRRALALEGALRMVESAAGPGAAIVVDDLQWADATSIAFVHHVVERLPMVTVVLAYRPEDAADGPAATLLSWLGRRDPAPDLIPLGALPRGALAGAVADTGIVDAIAGETGCTPFEVSEVVQRLADDGVVERDREGRWKATRPDAAELATAAASAGKRRAVAARIRWQSPERLTLVRLLALLGREASARLLAEAAGLEQSPVLEHLEALARAQLVRFGEMGWGTAHDLIAEVAAEDMEPATRARLHGMLARCLERAGADPAEIALHLSAAGDSLGAAEGFARAAAERLDRHAGAEAQRLAGRGLELGPSAALRSQLLVTRGEARVLRGDLSGAREDLQSALPSAPPGAVRSAVLARMAALAAGGDDLSHAQELARLALAEAGDDGRARAGALSVAANVDLNAGRARDAERRLAEALELFERTQDAAGIADVLDGRAIAAAMAGDLVAGADELDRVARLFASTGRLVRVVWPRGTRAYLLARMHRFDEALADVAEALDIARALGHPEAESYSVMEQALVLAESGRGDEATACACEALAGAERMAHSEWTSASLLALGAGRRASRDLPGAAAAYARAVAVAEQARLSHFVSLASAGLAFVLLAQGDGERAAAAVDRSLSEGTGLSFLDARAARAELASARRDPDAAALVARALERAAAVEDRSTIVRLRRLAALEERTTGT